MRSVNLMRTLTLATALGAAAAGCAPEELGADDVAEGDDLAQAQAALVDVMGNGKQNGFGSAFTGLADFCNAAEICQVADVSGDGRADLVAIDPVAHRVRLARNTFAGLAFDVTSQTLGGAIFTQQRYALGDADGDGKSDLFVCDDFNHKAFVLRMVSTNALDTTPRTVATGFCNAGEQLRVGDVDGNGRADALRFRMSSVGGSATGDVMVALGNGDLTWRAPTLWHDFFGINAEQVSVTDLSGDGKDDVVTCVPGAGVFVAMSNGTSAFSASRQPFMGLGPSSRLPRLADFAAAGQTCLTGDFDGRGTGTRGRHDLIVFTQGAGGFIDDFHDTRGDVIVGLSHMELDFTDAYRVGRPRIRHEDFCGAGQVCATGDLNGDGKDDVIAFAHGAGGSNAVRGAFSRFGLSSSWNIDLVDIRARVTEGTGDKPLILVLGFRSTVGVPGSTVITRNAYDENFATGIVAGGAAIAIPAAVGRSPMPAVRLPTTDNLIQGGASLEITGALVVVMEKDLSAAAAYSGLLDEATRALTTVLVNNVERKNLITFVTGGLDLSLDTLRTQLAGNMESAIDDLLHLFITGLFDPDDFINFQLMVFPAVDKELVGSLPAPSTDPRVHMGVPGEGEFGVFFGTLAFPDEDSPLWYDLRATMR